ncbi:MAG: GNAT family N-acetyltransferase [Candidatus Aegiribacteria sp.]|nr:GNAT family N-acetyltransferase [Candidatus Aegiribacteria sp.]
MTGNIIIRELELNEFDLWFSMDDESELSEQYKLKFDKRYNKHSNIDKRCFLLAFSDEKSLIGRLFGVFLDDKIYSIETIDSASKDSEVVNNAFGEYLYASFAVDGIEVLSWRRESEEYINKLLKYSGFVVSNEKVFVERNVNGYSSPYTSKISFRSFAGFDSEYIEAVLNKSVAGTDLFSEVAAPNSLLDRMKSLGDGSETQMESWEIAFLDDTPVGVVLPSIYDGEEEGTLLVVAVFEDVRGEGYGTILHARGLEVLGQNDVEKYMGSTESDNLAMQRIFRRHNCKFVDRQIYFATM